MKILSQIITLLLLLASVFFLQNCELLTEEEDIEKELTPEERIVGVWEMIEFNL